jgi:hypothetical protein
MIGSTSARGIGIVGVRWMATRPTRLAKGHVPIRHGP